ncbi:MAG TPA: EamA family transporter [Candidatus Dormibacteraeota bacterium]|nr:EamA family transporter [Candidatus Dormibacteraeota bacterium]
MSPERTARPLAVGVALVAVYTLWGSTYLGIRFAEETVPALLMGFTRFIVAGVLMLAWGFLRRRGAPLPTWREWRTTIIVGAALLLAGNGGVIWAEQHVPSGIAAILVALVPLHMAWLDRVFFKQPVSRWTLLGIAAGLVGLVVLVQPSGGTHLDMGGVAVLLFGSFCWAAGSLYARGAPMPRSAALASGMEMLAGGVLLGIAGVATGDLGRLHLDAISPKSGMAIGYLVVAGSLIGYSAYAWLLRNARTTLVSTYAYVNPVVAVLLGAAFASEPVTARTLVAGGIILAGVALIVARPAPRRTGATVAVTGTAEPAAAPLPAGVGVGTVAKGQ